MTQFVQIDKALVDKGFSLILFILYSMPSFFVGTLLLLQFAKEKENLLKRFLKKL